MAIPIESNYSLYGFHARTCLNEALSALHNDSFHWEYKIKRIEQEREDYINAFTDRTKINLDVVNLFDLMLKELPSNRK